MSDELLNSQRKKPKVRVHELMNTQSVDSPDRVNPKRERFLAYLKNKYGYTNEKAIDELERLLKQFYRTNRSLGIHRNRPDID